MKTAISLALVSLVSVFALSSCTNESPVSASASSDEELTSDARRIGHSEKFFAEDCIHGRGTFVGPTGQPVEFGFAAGIKNGAPRVHIRLNDRGSHFFASGGHAIDADDEGFARTFSGTIDAGTGLTEMTFEATAIDNGNDPANPDVFLIEFSNGYTAGGPITSGYIEITTHCQAPPGA
jgi:hypothetical protein